MTVTITANDIIELLANKHSGDVFVPECKTGSSMMHRSCRRLDAWVMKRTWSPITMIGYEVKVSRGDFLRDDKWRLYLDLCHQFYFVCPSKLIDSSELSAEAGLMWVSATGTRLYTKKKAPYRDVEPPADLMTYVLMSRSRITRDNESKDNREYWRDWLRLKAEDRKLGCRVSEAVREQVLRAESAQHQAEAKIATCEMVRRRLTELGLDPDEPINSYLVSNKLDEALDVIPRDLVYSLMEVAHSAERARVLLSKFQGKRITDEIA
jgi:hypothetical protein